MCAKYRNEEEIFNAALEIKSATERAAFLKTACENDDAMLARVQALLKVHYEDKNFLQEPPPGVDATLESSSTIEGPGTTIGRYKLLELLGEGGMGLVYLAEQKEPVRRRVALKIIKPGMDTKQVIARFEAERQALALLDHPNIARVLDAGTTETGRPYFVMEYVKGMSITRYSDEHKLDIEKRLKLFRQVCEAVHHAHQKGIIHRDIKPSNILVSDQDDRAVPKIIDFGIAKAVTQPLTQQTLFTRQGQLLGTPEYMSPEQADMGNEDIDTRADLYSLGVVLYELLTGALPFEHEVFEKGGFAEMQRILREEEPPSPSLRFTALGEEAKEIAEKRHTQVVALARRLHRELEWIPLKAMRKERSRRYRSASELADDIQNYLSGAPLIAGPETTIYRAKKFVRKHAGSVATVLLVAVAIILGLVVSTTMYFRAERALVRAEDAERVAQEQRTLAEDRAEDYRRALYVSHIGLANAEYQGGNIGRVRELLESCPNNLRGWEWHRLRHISDQALMTLGGDQYQTKCAAFSPDGKCIISGGLDRTIKIWDAETGAEAMTLHGHEGIVYSLAFSPDGKRIISGGSGNNDVDNVIKVWDASSGAEIMTLRGHDDTVRSLAFGADGKQIVSGGDDGTVRVWDLTTNREVTELSRHKREAGWCIAFSPEGKQIVGSAGNLVKVWDVATGAELATLRGHEASVMSVAFSPDGKRIVSGSRDKTIKIWETETGAEVTTLLGHEERIFSVAFSPNGNRIASGSTDATVKVWDAVTGTELRTLSGHCDEIYSVAFSPDGKRIVSGSGDGTIRAWDATTGAEVRTLRGHKRYIHCVAFSPDGTCILGGHDRTIKVWDAVTGAEKMTLRGHGGSVSSIGISPDGKRIVSAGRDHTVKLWDVETGAELMTFHGYEFGFFSVVFGPDGRSIAAGSSDGTIKVWESASPEEVEGKEQLKKKYIER